MWLQRSHYRRRQNVRSKIRSTEQWFLVSTDSLNGPVVSGLDLHSRVVVSGLYSPSGPVVSGLDSPNGPVVSDLDSPNGPVVSGRYFPNKLMVSGLASRNGPKD